MAPVNFGGIRDGSVERSVVDPRALYESLPGKPRGYGYLRDVQGQVLEAWNEVRADRDVVIKLNTGSGKTIDGLVILQSLLNEGEGPALYVAPNKQLADQVRAEAAKISIRVTEDPESVEYLQSRMICVIHAQKVFNGKSIFSNSRQSAPVPIGSVVIDDAHAAVATVRQGFTVRLPASDPGYAALLTLFASAIESYDRRGLADVREQAHGALLRIPYWLVRGRVADVHGILRAAAGRVPEVAFALPAVEDVLETARIVFSAHDVSIATPVPPIEHVSNFVSAAHRIFLTATLADDSVLVTHFGVSPEAARDPIQPATAGDIGERLILAPKQLNPSLDDRAIREAVATLARRVNCVVIAPSANAAQQRWKDLADEIVLGDDVKAAVARLREPESGPRLVVLVNRYDGIDLPEDACRVLVLDGLPQAASPDERLDSQLRTHAVGIDDRQIQRIEQGMGRGVRSNEDYCVVLLLGSETARLVSHPATRSRLGVATLKQLEISERIGEELKGATLGQILEGIGQVLDRDPDWVAWAKSEIAGLEPAAASVPFHAIARRDAFDAFARGDSPRAAQILADAAAHPDADRQTRGWLLEIQAGYVDFFDPARAQQLQSQARSCNPATLRPLVVNAYSKLDVPANQSQASAAYLSRFADSTEMRMSAETIIEKLQFGSETRQFEAALDEFGKFIGLGSQRPDDERGEGPDNIWALSSSEFWVMEAKSGVSSDEIAKRDLGQLGNSVAWFEKHYGGQSPLPVLVHRARRIAHGATEVPGMKVLTEQGIAAMCASLRSFCDGLADTGWGEPELVGRQLKSHGLNAASLSRHLQSHLPAKAATTDS